MNKATLKEKVKVIRAKDFTATTAEIIDLFLSGKLTNKVFRSNPELLNTVSGNIHKLKEQGLTEDLLQAYRLYRLEKPLEALHQYMKTPYITEIQRLKARKRLGNFDSLNLYKIALKVLSGGRPPSVVKAEVLGEAGSVETVYSNIMDKATAVENHTFSYLLAYHVGADVPETVRRAIKKRYKGYPLTDTERQALNRFQKKSPK